MAERTLEERLRSGTRLSREQALSIVRQCADQLDRRGLHAGHLTLADISLSEAAAGGPVGARLTDKLVRQVEGERPNVGLPGSGDAEYLSPEEILGAAKVLQSDQFSLAVIAYQLLCGRLPFNGGSLSLLFYEMCTSDPVAAHLANPELNGETSQVLEQAMAKDPTKRFPSCRDFANALANALPAMQPAPSATPVSPVPVFPDLPPARRRRLGDEDEPRRASKTISTVLKTGLIVIAVLVLLALGAWFSNWNRKQNLPVQAMDPQASPATPPPASSAQTSSSQTTPAPAPAPARLEADRSVAGVRGQEKQNPVNEPEPQADASIDFMSVPSGAQISIDDHNYCTAPCTLTLAAGRHVLQAKLQGFSPAQRIFHTPEEKSVMVALEESVGTLIVTSVPSGASVSLDGKDMGRTPLTLRVKPGQHRLDGFLGAEHRPQTVYVQADAIQGTSFDLR